MEMAANGSEYSGFTAVAIGWLFGSINFDLIEPAGEFTKKIWSFTTQ